MRRKLILIGAVALVLALLVTLAPACGDDGDGPGVTPTPGVTPGQTPTPGVTPTPTGEVKTLKMGFVSPLSGPAASWGTSQELGAKWAVAVVNEAGGIKVGNDTYMVELVSCDSQFTGSVATSCAYELLDEGIRYIIGPINPACTNAIRPILHEAKAFNVAMSSGVGPTPEYPYYWNGITFSGNGAWEDGHYKLFAELFPDAKTVIGVNPASYSQEWFDTQGVAAPRYGITVIDQKDYADGSIDFYPVLTPVVAQNPDAIDFLAAPPGDIALMIKQARELGYTGILMSPNAATLDLLQTLTGIENAEGYLSNQQQWDSPLLPPEAQAFFTDFVARFPEGAGAVQNTTISGYAAVFLYKSGIEIAGTIDTEKVKDAFDDPSFTFEFPGMGEIGIMGCQTHGICRLFPWYTLISQVQNGELITLGWDWHDVP